MHYGYDAFNRLDSTWGTHSHDTATYSLGMSYNDAGGILTKDQTGTGFNGELNYNFDYIYDNQDGSTPTHKKHRLNKVIDSPPYTNSTPFGTEFAYNKAGSLRAVATQINPSMPIDTVERFVYNEEQWLMGYQSTKAGAPQTFTHFAYDHTGERILKGGFTVSQLATNGQSRPLSLAMDPYTVYVNPYYVVEHYSSADHISKHYYMGTQRIATTVGYTPDTTYNTLRMADSALPGRSGALADNAAWILGQMGLDATQYTQAPAPEYDDFHGEGAPDAPENAEDPIGNDPPLLRVTYYYHPDYLGNVEYITDMNGLPYQYFWYSPWGESLKEHAAASSWESPYRFNGKELDEESGLYYYGARYYNPKVSVWLGVDPLAGKFPAISPLAFSANNPLLYIDPDGQDVSISGSKSARRSAYKQLRAELKLLGVELTMDKNGKLGYKTNENFNQSGTPGGVITFLETIDNSDYNLELAASFTNFIDRQNNIFHAGDAFIGAKFDIENETVSGRQFVNPGALGGADEKNGTKGKFMLHAATELATAAEAALNGRENVGRDRYKEFHSTWSTIQPCEIRTENSKEPIIKTHTDGKKYEVFETYFQIKSDNGWETYWTIPSEPFDEY